jgi:ACS family hexuronate transporter-like MFS transporter
VKAVPIRWIIAALLFFSTVINYIDRQTLSIVAPILTKEMNLSAIEYSNILSGFLIAYTLMYLGSGWLVDRWGTRVSLAVFITWWSASNMLHGFATNGLHLGIFRVMLGLGESGNFMAAIKVVSEWYPAKERAFVNGLVNAGASVGAIIAPPAVMWIVVRHGWRSAFVATGALGFIWLAAWLAIYRVPPLTEATAKQERASWASLLRYQQTWGLLLGRFLSDPVWWFYLFWLPKYLVEKRGFTIVEMGMLAWMPYLSADIGAIFGGLFSGYLIKRGWTVLGARSTGMWPFAAIMPVSIWIAYTPSRVTALALICLVTFAHMAWKTNIMTITNDIYPLRVVGSVSGIVAFGNGVGGTLFTMLTGVIVQHFSYNAIFIMMGFMHPMAYVLFRALVRKPIEESVP